MYPPCTTYCAVRALCVIVSESAIGQQEAQQLVLRLIKQSRGSREGLLMLPPVLFKSTVFISKGGGDAVCVLFGFVSIVSVAMKSHRIHFMKVYRPFSQYCCSCDITHLF